MGIGAAVMDRGATSLETQRVNGSLNAKCDAPPPVLIGALGPLTRKIAGAVADGTVTWMTGTRTLGRGADLRDQRLSELAKS